MPEKKSKSRIVFVVTLFALLLAAVAVLACLGSRSVYLKKDAV